jgi:hypothetical protein
MPTCRHRRSTSCSASQTKRILHSVSEFVQGQCELKEVPIDLSLELEVEEPGSLHLLPASPDLQTMTSILFEGYDVARLNEHVQKIAVELDLDLLIQDTHLGVNRETLLSLATSDTVLVLLRPDGQDHQGAFVLVQMAKKVGVPDCLLVPNMITIPRKSDPAELAAKIEKELCAPVAGLLPWCGELPDFGCQRGLFAARYPDHRSPRRSSASASGSCPPKHAREAAHDPDREGGDHRRRKEGGRTLRRGHESGRREPEAQAARDPRAQRRHRYGREHRFGSIDSLAEYSKAVPVTKYEDIAERVKRMAAGEPNILTAEAPVMFARTSGTTGEPKLIPSRRPAADETTPIRCARGSTTRRRITRDLRGKVLSTRLAGGGGPHAGRDPVRLDQRAHLPAPARARAQRPTSCPTRCSRSRTTRPSSTC